VLKLTRLNRSLVAVNPDQILWVEASPDTTLCLVGGEKLLVRESVEEVLREFIDVKRRIHTEPYFDWPTSGRFVAPRSSILPPIPSLRSLDAAERSGELAVLSTLRPAPARTAVLEGPFAIHNEESTS
jgi:flagellar protein FlbD